MVKKAQPSKKKSAAQTTLERNARRMVALAAQVAQDPEGTENQFDQLNELIEKYLADGQDQVIQRALEEAPDSAVYDELLDDVLACIEWQTVIGPDEEPVDLILFAVPLQLTLHAPTEARTVPITLPDINALSKSFRQQGLLGSDPMLVLQNYLYSLDELGGLSFSQRYALPIRMLEALDGATLPELFERTEPVELPPGEAHVLLRFILGLVIQAPDDPQPFINEDEDDQALAERGLAWMNAVARLVEQQLTETDLEVLCMPCFPAPLQAALQEGYQQHQALSFQITLSETLEGRSKPDALSAFIEQPANELDAFVITLLDRATQQPLLRYSWQPAPWDTLAEVQDSIEVILAQAGIDEVQIDDGAPGPADYLH